MGRGSMINHDKPLSTMDFMDKKNKIGPLDKILPLSKIISQILSKMSTDHIGGITISSKGIHYKRLGPFEYNKGRSIK